jgi:hydroxyethylthiazole kinase-like uncharacterized protein yjeF
MKFVSVQEMISIEHEADRAGLSYSMMMENAGLGLAKVIHERYQLLLPGPVLGMVGSGNNGGDTLVALSHLANWGWQTCTYVARPRPEGDPLMARLINAKGLIVDGEEDLKFERLSSEIQNSVVFLDGVLGTGIHLPLRGRVGHVLAATRDTLAHLEQPPAVVAVDCPSGVDCDSGEAAPESFPADLTVTMAAMKRGLLAFPAYKYVGDLELVEIGLTDSLEIWRSIPRFVVDSDYVKNKLPQRKLDAHKGSFGTALVIAGSTNYTGAALLAGQAAYRSGVGLVTLAVPAPLHAVLAGHFPEATWLPLPDLDGAVSSDAVGIVMQNLDRPTAVLIGPGFGLAGTTRDFIAGLLEPGYATELMTKPGESISKHMPDMVIDADGLKLLAGIPDWEHCLSSQAVLTPHPGEMSVLTGMSVNEIQADRLGVAEHYARQWGHVVVLKGAFTIIASPDGQTGVIPVATPALARAGTGDVLAGLIVGLRAQGVDAFNSALIGSWIHAQAGLRAAAVLGSTTSVIAGDILQGVIDVIATLSR